MTNHPVHLTDGESLFPTALIPFCEFGGSMSTMGKEIERLDVPVCNSFKPKIVEGQLCYSVDPNPYKTFLKKGRGKYHSLNKPLSFKNQSPENYHDFSVT